MDSLWNSPLQMYIFIYFTLLVIKLPNCEGGIIFKQHVNSSFCSRFVTDRTQNVLIWQISQQSDNIEY